MDLFSLANQKDRFKSAPLAVRMRPKNLNEFFGQEDIVGPGKFLQKMIHADTIPSIILFGPPGTGKTTLAQVIAESTNCQFVRLNAVAAGVGDIRKVVEAAKERLKLYMKRTILFIDEIHRFNKSQQDALLPYVEDGRIILIGATTENPYFEVNSPLLSRMRVIRLREINFAAMKRILCNSMDDEERGLGHLHLTCDNDALEKIITIAGGDARSALNILEQSASMLEMEKDKKITVHIVENVAGDKLQLYDKQGDNHYDVISAFIKSMRGSDADAALHYLARMLAAGEDLKFIARRIVICAAEDVGNADPQALVLAMTVAQAVQFIGMPEARIPLAQAVTYIACAPKSNAAYLGIDLALKDVRNKTCGSVPSHLRDAHYHGAEELSHGIGYRYPHDFDEGYVRQQYLPDDLVGSSYYHPSGRGKEEEFAKRLSALRKVDAE